MDFADKLCFVTRYDVDVDDSVSISVCAGLPNCSRTSFLFTPAKIGASGYHLRCAIYSNEFDHFGIVEQKLFLQMLDESW